MLLWLDHFFFFWFSFWLKGVCFKEYITYRYYTETCMLGNNTFSLYSICILEIHTSTCVWKCFLFLFFTKPDRCILIEEHLILKHYKKLKDQNKFTIWTLVWFKKKNIVGVVLKACVQKYWSIIVCNHLKIFLLLKNWT